MLSALVFLTSGVLSSRYSSTFILLYVTLTKVYICCTCKLTFEYEYEEVSPFNKYKRYIENFCVQIGWLCMTISENIATVEEHNLH